MTSPTPRTFALALATAAHETAIADLHAASWRAAYRDVLADRWLDEEALADRRALWRTRFAAPAEGQRVLVALSAPPDGGEPVLAGFACVFLAAHPAHGHLLENLHVAAGFRGLGLGERLLREGARLAEAAAPGSGYHLSVVHANVAARGFYAHLGARRLASEDWQAPDGRVVACEVMGWSRASDIA